MSIPTVIAVNQTTGDIYFSRLGLTLTGGIGNTLSLHLYAYIDEMRQDESLYAAVLAGNVRLDYGSGVLSRGDSVKFFNLVTQEVRISVRSVEDTVNKALTGGTTTTDNVVMVTGDRILLTAQTTATENGVWVVNSAGAWARPEDYDVGQSAGAALFYIEEGTNYAGTLWNCDTLPGSDLIGTNNLAFSQVSGGGAGADTLQSAYNNGNTITTAASRDIAFTLTSGDFTVDGIGDVIFGGTTPLGDFSVDTGTMSLDSTDTTNLSMSANDGAAKTLTIDATNAGLGTGNLDINVDDAITIDSTNAGFSLDGVTASNVSVTGAGQDLTLESQGGSVVVQGTEAAVDAVQINATTSGGGIDINASTGGITVDTTGTLVMQSVGASGWTNDSGNLAITTTTTGSVLIDGVDGVEINSTAGDLGIGTDDDDFDINIGTLGERQITIGNNTGVTGVAIETGSGNLLVDAPVTTMTGNLVVQGTTTTVESEIVNIKDQFLYLNDGYETTGSPRDGGIVVNVNPQATNDTVAAGGFTAAVPAVSNATVATTGAATFAAGDYIQIKGANDQTNDGLYEVLSHAANVLTIKGVGVTAAVYDFVQNDFATDATVAGTIRKVEVGVVRVNTSGDLDYAYGGDSTMTFEDVILTSTLTLQGAYDGGSTITTAGGDPVTIAGTEELNITATGGLNLDTVFDFDGTSFDVLMTGNNGFSLDGTASSNITVTNTVATTNAVLELTADNQGATSGDATVDINATSTNGSGIVDIDADDDVNIDVASGGTIDIGTDAVAQSVTVGNTTGASGTTINSGTEKVEIDGVTYYGASAGAPTATSSGFQTGDKYFDTNLEMEMRYDSTRAKFLSVEAMYLQFGRNGNTAADQYYKGIDGRIMGNDGTVELGYYMPHDGCIVGLGYTRSDVDAATFDIMESGVSRETLASAAASGVDNTLDGDVTAGGILQVMNQAGSNTTSDVMGWVKVRWRVTPP